MASNIDCVAEHDASNKTALFVSLFAANNRRIYAFVRTFIHNRADADEVFQETCTALWAKFDQFQEGTSFWGWACSVARFEALRFLRRQKTRHHVFSDAFYDAVMQRASQSQFLFDKQQDALSKCYAKLTDHQRDLMDRMYKSGYTPKDLAEELGRTANSIYKALERIHSLLYNCIQLQLKALGDQ
jgi:RNA polymerase sigma-70 factor, ECF subfamily